MGLFFQMHAVDVAGLDHGGRIEELARILLSGFGIAYCETPGFFRSALEHLGVLGQFAERRRGNDQYFRGAPVPPRTAAQYDSHEGSVTGPDTIAVTLSTRTESWASWDGSLP